MKKITWSLQKVPVADIKSYEQNPRQIRAKDYEQLKKSIDSFGLIDKPICNADLTCIGGHQRLQVLRESGVKKVEVWVPQRLLDTGEVAELCIRLNRNGGEWDWDALANDFEIEELIDWGFDAGELIATDKKEKAKKYGLNVTVASQDDALALEAELEPILEKYSEASYKLKL